MDYDSGPYNVTIPVGKTSGTCNITINDDDISEGNETFMITITSSASVTCVDHCQATLTVLDNDGKKVVCVVSVAVYEQKRVYRKCM